jgi:hypothetical protein
MATSAIACSESGSQYEAPTFVELGNVVELTKGDADDDTADMATARYW